MKHALFSGAAMFLAVSSTAFAQDKPIVAGAGLSPNMTDDSTNVVPPAAPADKTAASPDAKTPAIIGLAPADQRSPAEAAGAATGSADGVRTGTIAAGAKAADTGTANTEKSQADAAVQTPPTSAEPTAKPAADSAGPFVSVPAGNDLTSQVVGLDIYNASKQDIGTIKDIALGAHGVKAYIVGVGGFLGIGDHYVAVSPSALKLSYSADDKKWHAEMQTDAAQLKAAPEYKYPS